VVEHRAGAGSIGIEGFRGTILFAAEPADVPFVAVELGPSQPAAAIPLRFSVNRCDPHALAEVTKRYGVQLTVSLDGAEPQPVEVDVGPLVDGLDVILERCRQRSQTPG
jgi:hypothetical protein